ncbi:unnamed protein product [Fusarium graminearum]|uniref:Chromosome 2, complete genome n=1 Tax=Gibberella zeae (strain ATCC MYA-4620 / CBS 123657 / FGSC 9075 / NRRL 31084 / PH-1) TaxID=229533 RepID=A0A098DF10_GIBZE|nr:unnamed protein product [Fusarium graminearum]CZS80304.1 unnamed protein product [Fusarium graminearum]
MTLGRRGQASVNDISRTLGYLWSNKVSLISKIHGSKCRSTHRDEQLRSQHGKASSNKAFIMPTTDLGGLPLSPHPDLRHPDTA